MALVPIKSLIAVCSKSTGSLSAICLIVTGGSKGDLKTRARTVIKIETKTKATSISFIRSPSFDGYVFSGFTYLGMLFLPRLDRGDDSFLSDESDVNYKKNDKDCRYGADVQPVKLPVI